MTWATRGTVYGYREPLRKLRRSQTHGQDDKDNVNGKKDGKGGGKKGADNENRGDGL